MAGRARRWLRRIGLGLVAIFVFALGVVLAIFGTDLGTRVAAEEAVRRYSDSVPGTVAFDAIEGSLGGRVCIHGLQLSDAAEHELLTVELVCLEVHWSRLLHRAVEVHDLQAEGATVHLREDGNWSDLAKPSTTPPDALPGPDLGISLGGPVRVDRFALVKHVDGREDHIVDHAGLVGELHASGTHATASIADVWGWVESAQLWVADGRAEIAWDSPRVALTEVTLVSSAGVVESLDGDLDVLDRAFDARLRAIAIPPGDVPISLARVSIDASGIGEQAGAAIGVVAPGYGELDLHAVLGLGDARHASVVGVLLPTGKPSEVHFVAGGSLDGERRSAHAIVNAHQTSIGGALVGDDVTVVASMPGASADAALRLQENALAGVRAQVDVSSAAQLLDELGRLSPRPVPDFSGTASAHVEATCTHANAWRCTVDASARHEKDWLGVGGEVIADARAVVVELARLDGQVRREPVRLAGPARVRIADGAATISDVHLLAARGRVDADGTVAWRRAPVRSDLQLALHRIDLATIERFAPQVPLRGRVDGRVHLAGTAAQPELDASLTGSRLAWDGRPLGEVRVDADYAGGTANAGVEWTHRSSRATLKAQVPMVARLSGGTPLKVRTHRSGVLSLEVERFDLALLEPWLEEPRMRGQIDAKVHAGGTLADPTLVASITGAHLEHRGRDIGNAALDLAYGDAVIEAKLRMAGAVDGLAAARLPIDVDLAQRRVVHEITAEHRVVAVVHELDLRELEPWLGHRRLAGIVGGEVELVSIGGDARADALVVARDVSLDGQPVGAAEVQLHADRDGTEIGAQWSGAPARLVEVVARLPVELEGPARLPAWRSEDPIAVTADLRGVDLGTLGRLVQFHAIDGDLEGAVTVDGTAAAPRMHAAIDVDALESGGKELGYVRLVTSYDDEMLVAEVQQQNGVQQLIASGQVPIRVDASRGSFVWHRDREHRISLHAKGIDEQVVGAMVELPSDLRFRLAAEADVVGTVDDPRGRVRLRGNASSGDALPSPVALLVEASPTEQEATLMIGGLGPSGLTVDARANAVLPDLLAGRADIGAIEVDVHAHATDFYLQELAPMLPNMIHDPRGKLQLHASIEGPLRAPELRGAISMKNGAFTLVPLNQRFREVDIEAEFEGPDVALRRFTARSGDGSASITANLHVAPGETRGEAKVTARKLPVVRPGLPMMTVSTRIDAALDATGALTRIGLAVHDGFIDVLEAEAGNAAERIPEDDGVTYVDRKGQRAATEAKTDARTPWLPRDFELAVKLADPVRVRGASADMDWGGAVTVRRVGDGKASAEGEISTSSGYVALLGNEFDIGHGRITLPPEGDLDPYVDLVATVDTEEALVTMTVRGRVSRPALRLESAPPMEESDIFALLVTGHSSADDADEGDFSAKAASLLAAFENPALQRQLRDKIGIDRVGVGFGETVEQPIVTVGKRLTRKVYVEAAYHHNAPVTDNQAEVRLEYRFHPPQWSVETYFGDRAEGGVGLWWRRRFGGPGKPEKDDAPKQRRKEQARRNGE